MSITCNTCGASISVYASEEEIKKFAEEHFGDKQPTWHREKRKREDAEVKEICERWVDVMNKSEGWVPVGGRRT